MNGGWGQKITNRWAAPGGYREFLMLAVPLILSTGAWSIQHFVDRMFLTWYSSEAIAASMPAGLLNFTLLSLFLGTASYTNTFVAQYFGAGQPDRIGAAVWQGLYFSLIGAVFMVLVSFAAGPIFRLAGHAPAVQQLEREYFTILCLGAFFPIASAALASFFTGRSDVWTVMTVNFFATAVNIVLDYLLIFGNAGAPKWGIRGAAIATVLSGIVSFAVYSGLFLKKSFRQKFGTWRFRRMDAALFRRLVHFGLPNGVQFFLDMLGFALFIILVGRFGTLALAATNIAFNINTLAFMPMIGSGIAVAILVGQRLGENRPGLAERSVWSAAHLTFCYMSVVAAAYVVLPDLFLTPFGKQADPETFVQIHRYGVVLLRFVAFYSLFDAMNIVFANAIKGAGDTRFVMKVAVLLSWLVMVIPTYLVSVWLHWSLFAAWGFATAYIVLLGIIFLLRFLRGKWKEMRVIEEQAFAAPVALPDAPSAEL